MSADNTEHILDRRALQRLIFELLERAGADGFDSHAAITLAYFESLDRLLREGAAVREIASVQPWLAQQIAQLRFYVVSWQPGASPAAALDEAFTGHAHARPN